MIGKVLCGHTKHLPSPEMVRLRNLWSGHDLSERIIGYKNIKTQAFGYKYAIL